MTKAEFSGPLPASIMEKLPFKARFLARWYDVQAHVQFHLPRNFRQAASYLAWREYERRMLAVPSTPKEGQRWHDASSGEIKEFRDGKVRVVRRAR